MKHLRSAPGGLAQVGWPRLLAAVTGLWLGTAIVGAVLLLPAQILPGFAPALWLLTVGGMLVLSPGFAWIGWIIAVPAVAALLHTGWFGWFPAAATGAVAGMIAGSVAASEVAASFGLVMLILLRALLGRTCPAGFALPRGF